MKDATRDFLQQLGQRGHEPVLEKATGNMRMDLEDKGKVVHWFVRIKKGDVTVSHENHPAETVLRCEKATFDDIVMGKMNAMAAVLRGAIRIEGDPTLLVLFQRLFPAFGEPVRAPAQAVKPQ